MSWDKMDPVVPTLYQKKIIKTIAQNLCNERINNGETIKTISRKIHADPRTVKNWCEECRAPSLGSFIALAKCYPKITEQFLRIAKYGDLADTLARQIRVHKEEKIRYEYAVYYIIFDTIKPDQDYKRLQNLNQRQIWFYLEIGKGRKLDAQDIVAFWHIGIATARRDIAKLFELDLIAHTGSKRNGCYVHI